MKFSIGAVCTLKSQRNWVILCVLLTVALLLYRDPFLFLWWPYEPAEELKNNHLPLDMATESVDDMYDGCRLETTSVIDLFGVFESHFNNNFSYAWASAETEAKKPLHKQLKEDHTIVMHMFTKMENIRQDFNEAVKMGKHKYSTFEFQFHYLYFYLTDAIQVLRHNQMLCRTTYHRTGKQFDHRVINTNMRFGAFTWTTSSKDSFDFNGNVSCFEINACFGADITYYSAANQAGQVLIPPYEVFTITDVLTNDPWCDVVYKLHSTKTPQRDLNCKLNEGTLKTYFGDVSNQWHTRGFILSAYLILLTVLSLVLLQYKQIHFVLVMLRTLQVLMMIFTLISLVGLING